MGDEPTNVDEARPLQNAPGDRLRVLLANEPRAYRESIAAVFGELRPDFDVRIAAPEDPEGRVGSFVPDGVICGRLTGAIEERVPVWVELYPEHLSHSAASERGRRTDFPEMQLADLLSIADRAAGAVPGG